ncbi:hypothetical protein ACT3TZ_14670 [Brachybacterium sp. AOP25-B2-12]|uniref:hypothetical protein n=1 Tax=Brachybacterium sp. AOP25-B2-12 TaxID=3457710 RepID=UPI00403355E3
MAGIEEESEQPQARDVAPAVRSVSAELLVRALDMVAEEFDNESPALWNVSERAGIPQTTIDEVHVIAEVLRYVDGNVDMTVFSGDVVPLVRAGLAALDAEAGERALR